MKLPKMLSGKITVQEWEKLRPDRLIARDRRDMVDILFAIQHPPSPSNRDIRDVVGFPYEGEPEKI